MWIRPAESITARTPAGAQAAEPGTSAGVDQPAASGGSLGVGDGASVGSEVGPDEADSVGAGVGAALASGGSEGDAEASGASDASPTGGLLGAALGKSEADAEGPLAQPPRAIARLATSARDPVLGLRVFLDIPPTPAIRARSARGYSSSHLGRRPGAGCCAGRGRYLWLGWGHPPGPACSPPEATGRGLRIANSGASAHEGPSQSAIGMVVLVPHPPSSCRLLSSCGRREVQSEGTGVEWFET